jgi:DNA-binding GntR family transcriptional regulator
VSRSTLREAQQILVHEGLLVSGWGVGSFVTDQLPNIVKGRNTDVNVPLPLQRIEPHWTLLTDEETTAAAEDAVATLGRVFFERTSRCCGSTRRYLTSTAGRSA